MENKGSFRCKIAQNKLLVTFHKIQVPFKLSVGWNSCIYIGFYWVKNTTGIWLT